MCITIIKNDKEIKLKRLQRFNHHIHKRFYIDATMGIWYKPKGKEVKEVPFVELEQYATEYPASMPLIFQLINFGKFIKNNKLS